MRILPISIIFSDEICSWARLSVGFDLFDGERTRGREIEALKAPPVHLENRLTMARRSRMRLGDNRSRISTRSMHLLPAEVMSDRREEVQGGAGFRESAFVAAAVEVLVHLHTKTVPRIVDENGPYHG